jgi:hypothetical protein
MTTILVKNLPENVLKQLRKLKVDLGCRTWAELLAKLVESKSQIPLSEERLNEMSAGVQDFLRLRTAVSSRWAGQPTVLEESRRSRGHDANH